LPAEPGRLMIPSLVGVAASAITSGTTVSEAVRRRVLTPPMMTALARLVQLNPNVTSVEQNAAVGVSAMMKLWGLPATTLTGVFGVPVGWFVVGSVTWKLNGVGKPVSWVMPHVMPVRGARPLDPAPAL